MVLTMHSGPLCQWLIAPSWYRGPILALGEALHPLPSEAHKHDRGAP